MGSKSPVRERSHAGFHNGRQHDASTRPKQLRNREVPWEGSHRSNLMSRRIERSYKADGMDKLAPHSKIQCSVPEVNDPVAQGEFTSLLREACAPGSSATKGAAVREDRRASTGVSRGHSTGSNEPVMTPDGLTTREGLNLAGRHDHRWSCPGAMRPNRLSYGQRSPWQRECCVIPRGLPGTAVRGPACTVVWEPGGETLRADPIGRLHHTAKACS